jgi:hypothetical protein
MTDAYEAAREQYNLIERLAARIPGYRGFQRRELRREVDRRLREQLARQLRHQLGLVRNRARAWTDAGRLQVLGGFDRLDRGLDRLSLAVQHADYGASGLFDAVKIGAAELEALYRFDLSLLDELAALEAALEALPEPPAADHALLAALGEAHLALEAAAARWRRRDDVVAATAHGASAGQEE